MSIKVHLEVDVLHDTILVQTLYDIPEQAPDRALRISREIERLMETYPAYSVITLQLEREYKNNDATHIQEPSRGEPGEGPRVGPRWED
jgi:hypothetical protein